MRRSLGFSVFATALGVLLCMESAGAQVIELQGAWLIDGYTFQPGDRSPRGTIVYDREAHRFRGTYVGLKLPAERPELHAWLYDTRSKKALHLGRGDYKPDTVGKDKGTFTLTVPASVKKGSLASTSTTASR